MKTTLTATIAAAVAVTGCRSGPAYPHAWCGPLITQFHAHEDLPQYLAGLASTGAPVGKLIADISAYEQDKATANVPGTAGFDALASAPAALDAVTADLQDLNNLCAQTSGAYKGDDV